MSTDQVALLQRLGASEMGDMDIIATPFGDRHLVYADYVASGRSVDFIEATIAQKMLPLYANTHTETSHCGHQMNQWRTQAREYIASQVGADPASDVVLFTGAGCTGAINLLVGRLARLYKLSRAVVFMGPYEHHSNDLVWRESGAKIVRIRPGKGGGVDLAHLKNCLEKFRRRALLIGTFSAASNITGITTETVPVTQLLKSYGALALWDYAAAAPYMPIDMHEGGVAKDAIFFSVHKFLGGPGTPGVLVVKQSLFSQPTRSGVAPTTPSPCTGASAASDSAHTSSGGPESSEGGSSELDATNTSRTGSSSTTTTNNQLSARKTTLHSTVVRGVRKVMAKKTAKMNDVPVVPGGGTVFLVSRRTHQYVDDIAEREEGGTPDIVGALRAAMVFQLKATLGVAFLESQEHAIATRVQTALGSHSNIVLLGDPSAPRLPTFSFLIRHETLFLHPQFVARLLSDLFGIQSRSGCACAGPYGALLFQMPDELAHILFSLMQRKALFIKPGFTRLNFPVYWSSAREAFVVEAIRFVADHGWRFVPLYDQCLSTGVYTYRGGAPELTPLADVFADLASFTMPTTNDKPVVDEASVFAHAMGSARGLASELKASPRSRYSLPDPEYLVDPVEVLKDLARCDHDNMRHFCWFLTSHDVLRKVFKNVTPDRVSVFRPLFNNTVSRWPAALTTKELKALNKVAYMEADKVHSIYGPRIVQKLMGFK
ncbi:hypothetical protein SPRG_10814 [Saprolegnia parasitica CBS 223.65]|uniref:Aminotransferase class V domain-containing protein n=1 Tax=Saprolegnia parasitica (strain CBS 223.65) TaxID=695850 RepID=A0A067CBV0_SAPPC|nr:hypothetical protein SPRG_10814 [Saprolegnia parasitica CBS 223.65]KDO24026.1 hypothetical protein SPRG_10814 [Saprolegnia parasitica CBS 223.65]|eukprot:XP_012205165.1 hypothetical protein SPRG_10814 [Saprolegnia parasitica CBS 223.65]